MERAVNPKTGEVVFLVDNEWVKPAQTATNPDTGETAYLVNNQWEVIKPTAPQKPTAPVAKAPTQKAAPAEETPAISDPLGTGASEIMGVAQPKKASVLEGRQMPAQEPSPISLGVDPKFVAGMNQRLDSMPRDQRDAAIAQMQERGGIYAQVAQAYAAKQAQLDARAESPVTKRLDPRLESRVQRKIEQGRGAEGAVPEAQKEAIAGYEERLPQMTETPEEIVRLQQEYGISPKMTGIEETARVLKRIGAKGLTAGQQGYYGTVRAFTDVIGAENQDVVDKLNYLDARLQNMGESKNAPIKFIENAATSIIQQAPAMIGGLLTGSEPLVLANMFAQSFGQSYDESRRLGMAPDESIARSGANAAFEVIGERLGLGAQMKAIKASAKGIPLSDLAGYYAKALAREIPGEEITYAGQFGVDKLHGVNAEAGIKDFLQGAMDTAITTVTQAGMMLGGGATVNKIVRSYQEKRGALPTEPTPTEPAPELPAAVEKPTPPALPATERVEPKLEGELGAAPPAAEPKLEPTGLPQGYKADERQALLEERATQIEEQFGIGRKDALRLAETEIAKQEGKQVAAVPYEAPPEDRVEALTQEFIGVGFRPEDARTLAIQQVQEEEQADELARREAETGQYVAPTDREGVQVAGQPSAVPAPAGVGEPESSGLVPAGQPAPKAAKRKRAAPAPVDGEAYLKNLSDREALLAKADTLAAEAETALGELISLDSSAENEAPLRQKIAELNAQQDEVLAQVDALDVARKELPTTPAAPVEKGKRGPKGARLTPEQKAASAAATKEQTKLWKSIDKGTKQAVKDLNKSLEELDPEQFPDIQTLQQTVQERRLDKFQAIRTLLELQKQARGKVKLEAAINEALANPAITPQEIADIKKGIELSRKPSASMFALAKPSEDFKKATNGAQALTQIIKTGNAFEKLLAARLRGFVSNVKFVVIEKGDPLPEQLQTGKNAKAWERARGLFIQKGKDKTVYVRGSSFGPDQGVNNVTVLHEMLHAATNKKIELGMLASYRGFSEDAKITKFVEEINGLAEYAQSVYEYSVQRGIQLPAGMRELVESTGGDVFTDPREFVAYGMSDPVFQEFLNKLQGRRQSGFSQFVQAILRLFGLGQENFSALSDLIDVTDQLLSARKTPTMELVERGLPPSVSPQVAGPEETEAAEKAIRSQKEVDKAVAEAEFGYKESVKGAQMAQDPKEVIPYLRMLWDKATEIQRKALVRIPTTEFLADWASNVVPELKRTNEYLEKMSGMSLQFLKSGGRMTKDMDRTFRANPGLEEKLSKIANMATIAEVDPGDPLARERSPKLDQMWKDLGPEGRRLYKQIRDYFGTISEYFSQLLDDQITNSGLPLAEQANLIKKIRAMYETGSKITPYFPLVRFGDYWLSIGSGKNRKFFMFENESSRDAAVRMFAKERYPKGKVQTPEQYEKYIDTKVEELLGMEEYKIGNDIAKLRAASVDSSEMLKGIFSSIDSMAGTDTEAKESLKDSVYQIYLQTMPEQSFRRQFIHRKGYAGYSPDILRSVATAASKMSLQLARLKYAPLLRNSLSQANDSITNRPKYAEYVREMERRVGRALSSKAPSTAEHIVGWLNKASYIWYLGGISSALLQPLSIIQTGLPVLMSQHNPLAVSREFGRMMKIWDQYGVYETLPSGEKVWVAPSIEYASGLTPDERRAVREMLNRDVTTSTYATDALDYKNTPSGKRGSAPIVGFGKGTVDALVLGGLMHSTERMSREIVYLMSYRLNRQSGKTHEAAIDAAVRDTNESMGNYGQYNRPAFMQGAVGKFLTQFMMYPVHVTLFLFKNFKEMIKPMNGRTRTEAALKFFGTLGMTWILGGYAALPWVVQTIVGLLGAMWKALGDEDKEMKELRDMDFQFWFRTVWLPENLGGTKIGGKSLAEIFERGPTNALTGLDISSRTSLNNLWMRDTKEYKTIRENAAAMALEKAGPSANMILSWAEAYEAFMQGDYKKGVQKATPAGFRNFANAYELWKEGAKDNKGVQLLSKDAFTTGELIGQAVGFRSDQLSNLQYVTFKVIGLEQKILNERNLLLNQLKREHAAGNGAAYAKYIGKMNEFNKEHPSYAIDADDLYKSIFTAAEQRAASYRGVGLTEKNVPVFGKALAPSRIAAREKEEKGRE